MFCLGPKYPFLFVLAWLVRASVLAQTSSLPLGKWQLHVPNYQAKAVALTEDKVYCATEHGIFYYDKSYNQLKTLSKTDGLSNVNISTLAYDQQTKTLVIAYQNTNIDLLQDGEIINIDAVFRKQLPEEKQFYHIYFKDKVAYLSASFGLVLLDLAKLEIKDTYSNLGPAGQPVKVYSSTILNDSIYLATSIGIMAARRSQNNLLDYRNWKTFTTATGLPPANATGFRQIAAFQNKVFAAIDNRGVYRYNGQAWEQTNLYLQNKSCRQLSSYPDYLLMADGEQLQFLNQRNQVTKLDASLLVSPQGAVPDANSTFWVADYQQGLIKLTGSVAEALVPQGPMFNGGFRLYPDEERLLVLGGGYNPDYQPYNSANGFEVLTAGEWQTFNAGLFPNPQQYPPVRDLVSAVRQPGGQKLYLASYGSGLIAWEGLGKFNVYDPTNSPLLSVSPTDNTLTRITDLAADASGNIWVINRHQQVNAPGLHVLHPNGQWQSFAFPGFPDGGNLEKIIIAANGYKWITLSQLGGSRHGLLVFDENTNQYRHLGTSSTAGNLPAPDVNTLVQDKTGAIWVGTNNGVAVFYDPENVFAGGDYAAVKPIINHRPLLESQVVRTIAVDAANRKWIGTESGLWLFSEDGEALVAHFNTQNSPLLSDKILDIALINSTGEVFVLTDKGLVSYRGTATETAGKPDCAVVFPNPVRPGFSGLVGISGLPNNALVKITDVAGTLVYQAQATGGTLAWDLRAGNGKRVKPGVYLAFSATPDGSQSCISKIAVIE